MNIRLVVTGLLVALAVGGGAYVFIGGGGQSDADAQDQLAAGCGDKVGSECAPGCTGDKAAMATAATSALPADGVVVYYFHGHQRCQTCKRMETLADLAISEGFAEQQQSGVVVFQIVNIEEDATRHFVNDFQLTNRSVVMLTRQNGKDLQWRRLDKVWEKISDDDAYKGYISENLAACLQELEAGPS